MPALIKTIDEIVQEKRTSAFWLRFADPFFADRDTLRRAKEDHFAWFDEQGLSYETAAPRGWLEGDPGCFAVGFDGPDDPRLQAYSAKFERQDGGSLETAIYQMYIVPFGAAENG